MKKKMMIVITCALLFVLLVGTAVALARTGTLSVDITYRNIRIVVNGEQATVPEENEPFILGGRTYVPLRVVSETLGYEVGWDGATSTVFIDDIDLPVNGEGPGEPCDGCWDYQPTSMQPNPGWENVDLEGLTRQELLDVLGCPPHVIRMTSVVSESFNRELWVYHPYEEDPTGLYIWLKGNVFHESLLDEFNGFGCYQMTDPDFWE